MLLQCFAAAHGRRQKLMSGGVLLGELRGKRGKLNVKVSLGAKTAFLYTVNIVRLVCMHLKV